MESWFSKSDNTFKDSFWVLNLYEFHTEIDVNSAWKSAPLYLIGICVMEQNKWHVMWIPCSSTARSVQKSAALKIFNLWQKSAQISAADTQWIFSMENSIMWAETKSYQPVLYVLHQWLGFIFIVRLIVRPSIFSSMKPSPVDRTEPASYWANYDY